MDKVLKLKMNLYLALFEIQDSLSDDDKLLFNLLDKNSDLMSIIAKTILDEDKINSENKSFFKLNISDKNKK